MFFKIKDPGFISCFCHSLILLANKLSSPTIVQIFQPIQMISTILFSYFIFGEKLFLQDYVGTVTVQK
jgi:drug/metabolite transporter (DMT)-like permease